MKSAEDYTSVEEFVAENQEMLVRVLRHSSNSYARACAWALLDKGSDPVDLAQLQQEFNALQEARKEPGFS